MDVSIPLVGLAENYGPIEEGTANTTYYSPLESTTDYDADIITETDTYASEYDAVIESEGTLVVNYLIKLALASIQLNLRTATTLGTK